MLFEEDDIQIDMPFSQWIDELFQYPTINPLPFDEATVKLVHHVSYHTDPFDRSIVASALQVGLPLITKDKKMHNHAPCELFWD